MIDGNMINSSVRKIRAEVELLGSTYSNTYSYNDDLISIDIERLGEENKFFGFGVCQKAKVKIRDPKRSAKHQIDDVFNISFGNETEGLQYTMPALYVTDIKRDENTNELTITGYDLLYSKFTSKHTVSELNLSGGYTIREFAEALGVFFDGAPVVFMGVPESTLSTYYSEGANFEGTETIREALNAVAEATQTIYYLNYNDELIFKRLDKDGDAVLTIGKQDYITLASKTNRRLTGVVHATELGDNVAGVLIETASGVHSVKFDDVVQGTIIEAAVESKNLFNMNVLQSGSDSMNGSQYVNNSGTIVVSGGYACFTGKTLRECCPRLKVGDTVVFNIKTTGTRYMYLREAALLLVPNKVVTIDETMLNSVVGIYGKTDKGTYYIECIQLEYGSTMTDCTRYIDDFSKMSVVAYGKNLMNVGTTTFTKSKMFASDEYNIPAGTYTISGVFSSNAPAESGAITFMYADGSGYDGSVGFKIGVSTRQSITVTFTKPLALMYINAGAVSASTGYTATITDFQLEMGSVATSYEPFVSNYKTYTPEVDGTIKGIEGIAPITVLIGNELGAVFNCKCMKPSKLEGVVQYVRNNPFWELREDITDLVNEALAAVYTLSINQFDCSWRGNFLLEIGDKIELITKDDNAVVGYVLNDSISYNGGLSEKTKWNYDSAKIETPTNPSTLGEMVNYTYARVNKIDKQVDIVASETSANTTAISALQLNTESITASVSKMEEATNGALEVINGNVATLTSKVEAQITPEDVKLEIKSELANGVDKVTTSTGFTFNDEGLTVSKTGSEITTTITEDGMAIKKDSTEVLTANNEGVKAIDLHATTYLIIGNNSRFEDYGSNRTGCFWIGG